MSKSDRHSGQGQTMRFVRDEPGAILPVVAVTAGVMLGFGALAVDMSRGYLARDQLQAAAE